MSDPAQNQKTIAVIDDSSTFSELIRGIAEKMGLKAAEYNSGSAFKAAFLVVKPDIVIIDIVMPDIDGIEVIKWLAQQDHRCPIIIVSGKMPEYLDQAAELAKQAGLTVTGTRPKPINGKDMADLIQQALASA